MNGRSTRVLFVGAFPPPQRDVYGGMVSSCRALLQSSFAQRVDLDLLDTTQISNPPPTVVIRSLLAVQRFVRYVWRFERRRPDAVLLFAAVGASLIEKGAMAWYARLRRVPALMFPRGGIIIDAYQRSRLTRWWVTIAFRGARKVLCQSERWQRFAVDRLGFRPEDAPVIMNWTASPELLAIGTARKPRSVGRPRLLFLGWLDREKGVGELLEACRALAATREFTLEFAGEGNHSDAARGFVAQCALGSVIMFSGWLRGDDLLSALASADVLVLPSWAEGLPNAMIEAMAARLAVVVTNVGGIPDVAVDGEHALLIPPRDVRALQAALARVIDDVPLRHSLADSGFALAATRFGAERAADQIVGELRAVVTRSS
jgi:glycosyltransferase involved in cell wall biosynthesis